jgi:hypothetical protein
MKLARHVACIRKMRSDNDMLVGKTTTSFDNLSIGKTICPKKF